MVSLAPDVRRRARARLVLAACTFALAVGLGISLALPAVLAQPEEALTIQSPGDTTAPLRVGRHVFSARGSELPLEDTRPICTALRLRPDGEREPVPVVAQSDSGFAAMRVRTAGDHQVACSSAVDGLLVTVARTPTGGGDRLLRAALATVGLTALAVLLAARPLVALRRMA